MGGVEADRPLGAVAWRVLSFQTIETDAGPISLSRRPRAVLLRLLLQPNRSVSIDAIIDFVWGEEIPKTAANSVARFVADLRKALGPRRDRIVTVDGGYQVVVHPGELDLDRAEAILAEAERLAVVDPERCRTNLRTGLQLVGSEPNIALAELPDTAAVLRSHDALRQSMLNLHADVELRLGSAAPLVPTLEEAVARYPFNESFWMQLMRALDGSGRTAEALRAGQRSRQALADAGLEPSAEFVAFESAIAGSGQGLTGDPASAGSVLQRGPVVSTRIANVPLGIAEPTTRMVGRLGELTELESMLGREPAISIVGIGGCGKTRLAIALVKAIEATGRRVVRVALGPVPEPDLVLATIAAALGVPAGSAGSASDLAAAVATDSMLLLLDNCEHVTEAVSAVVAAIYERAPQVQVVATSRQALGFAGESVFHLGMLSVPDEGETSATSSAVALLIDRASPHLDSAQPTDDALGRLCDIARLVSGHPMALEVAASQLAYVSLDELADRLAGSFGTADDDAELPDALAEVMDWTWTNLAGSERAALARTAVFGDTWTLDAAQALAPAQRTLGDDLDHLAARGLITTTVVGGTTRYGMLEPARNYAIDRLGDRAEIEVMRGRMAAWLGEFVQRWTTAEHHVLAAASAALFEEHGNLLAALDHLDRQGAIEELAELAINASGMWINHGFADEVKRWLTPIIEDESVSARTRSGAAAMALAASHAAGDLDRLNELGNRAIELADGEAYDWIPATASFLSLWALFAPGEQSGDELLALARSTAERSASSDVNLAVADLYHAHVVFCSRDFDSAAGLFGSVRTAIGRPGRLSHVAEVGQGLALMLSGRHDEARAELATWTSQNNTDDWHYMVDLVRAVIRAGIGDAERATSELADAVRRFPPARVWGRADEIQIAFGILALLRGEVNLGEELLSTVETRDVLLTVTAIELLAGLRGVEDDLGWLGIAQEFWERVLPEGSGGRGAAWSSPELLSWWVTGPTVSS
ncbi:MAG: BTAD domain-containing putative transcriptional regulator [Actinomycetota bacterium]